LHRVLDQAGYSKVAHTTDPLEAVSLYEEFQPDLICLDLQMPTLDGFGVLEQLESWIPRDTYLPILVLTGDASAEAKQRALSLGAKDFVAKPFDKAEVLLRIHNLLTPRFMHLELAAYSHRLERQVEERTRSLKTSRLEVLSRLALAGEFRDDATGKHTQRVGRIAALLSQSIGMDRAEVELIAQAAPLHDIGKIGVPDKILLKPGKLTAAEFEVMKRHAAAGAELLSGGHSTLIRMAADIAHHHHERWDATGYPEGLKGEAISLPARVVGLVDVFDALTHARPYRPAWPLQDVLDAIRAKAGAHFDPQLVPPFMTLPHLELM
jgi:putative two-component system response regulator